MPKHSSEDRFSSYPIFLSSVDFGSFVLPVDLTFIKEHVLIKPSVAYTHSSWRGMDFLPPLTLSSHSRNPHKATSSFSVEFRFLMSPGEYVSPRRLPRTPDRSTSSVHTIPFIRPSMNRLSKQSPILSQHHITYSMLLNFEHPSLYQFRLLN